MNTKRLLETPTFYGIVALTTNLKLVYAEDYSSPQFFSFEILNIPHDQEYQYAMTACSTNGDISESSFVIAILSFNECSAQLSILYKQFDRVNPIDLSVLNLEKIIDAKIESNDSQIYMSFVHKIGNYKQFSTFFISLEDLNAQNDGQIGTCIQKVDVDNFLEKDCQFSFEILFPDQNRNLLTFLIQKFSESNETNSEIFALFEFPTFESAYVPLISKLDVQGTFNINVSFKKKFLFIYLKKLNIMSQNIYS